MMKNTLRNDSNNEIHDLSFLKTKVKIWKREEEMELRWKVLKSKKSSKDFVLKA